MAYGLQRISPLWGQFNPLLARRIPKLAYFPTNSLADYIDTPAVLANTTYLRSLFTARFYIRPVTWTPASDRMIFAFGNTLASNWAVYCALNSLGQIYAVYSKSGTTINGGDVSSTPLGLADNEGIHIAVSRYYGDGAGFVYKSVDGVSWTDITDTDSPTTGLLYNTTSTLKIGGGFSGFGAGFEGYIGNFRVVPDDENPTAETFCSSFNPSIYSSGSSFACPTTFNSSPAQTWTLRGSASIVGPML